MSIDRTSNPTSNYTICTSSTRPSSPNEGMMIYETDTGLVLIYDGSDWQEISPVIPHTAAVRVTQSTGSTSSGSFTTPPTAVQISNFIKYRSDTKIVYNVLCTAWKFSTLQNVFIGVNDGTNTTEVAALFHNNTGVHGVHAGTTEVGGLNAGTYTFGLRWRVGGGFGNVDANDWWCLSVTESL